MKVCVTNPPWRKGDRIGVRAGSRWPFTMEAKGADYVPFPFYLAYATALLDREGIEVKIIDAVAERVNELEFLEEIRKFTPDIVLIETSTPSIEVDIAIAKRIKEISCASIVLSGPHVTIFGGEILQENPFIDYILRGEYEETLLDLVRHLEGREGLDDVLGLIYRKGTQVSINPRRPPIEDIDSLPYPARHLLSVKNYRDEFCQIPQPALYIWASRGCPYHCVFCLWPKVMYDGHKYRVRDPQKVVEEITREINRYDYKSIYFDDDTFNLGKERICEISRLMKEEKIDLPWAVMARADTMDEETLRTMRSAGLFAIKYGIESGVQEIIDHCGKSLNLKKVEEIVKLTKKLGIRVHLTFSFGLPGETRETIEQTIRYALRLDPYSLQFSIVTPFPGTEYFYWAKKKGLLLSEEWPNYDGSNKAVIRTEELSGSELESACIMAYKKWYRHIICRHALSLQYIKEGILHPAKVINLLRQLLR